MDSSACFCASKALRSSSRASTCRNISARVDSTNWLVSCCSASIRCSSCAHCTQAPPLAGRGGPRTLPACRSAFSVSHAFCSFVCSASTSDTTAKIRAFSTSILVRSACSSSFSASSADRSACSSSFSASSADRSASTCDLCDSNFERCASSSNFCDSSFDCSASSSDLPASSFDCCASSFDRCASSSAFINSNADCFASSFWCWASISPCKFFLTLFSNSSRSLASSSLVSLVSSSSTIRCSSSLNFCSLFSISDACFALSVWYSSSSCSYLKRNFSICFSFNNKLSWSSGEEILVGLVAFSIDPSFRRNSTVSSSRLAYRI
mmetsp:Transcript_81722/g.144188  ORF Transcript_81722/g.144188 Transcript_81722/m.144188 type:complete len:323 (+) Transcript_81722:1677-2645(+)